MLCCVKAETLSSGCRVQAGEATPGPGGKLLPSLSETETQSSKNVGRNEKKIYKQYTCLFMTYIKYGFIDSDTNCSLGLRWAICCISRVTHHMLPNYVGGRNCYHHHWARGAGQWSRAWRRGGGGRGTRSRARYEVPTLPFTVGTLYLARENAVSISFFSWPFFILEVFLSHLWYRLGLRLASKHEGFNKHL